MDAIFLFLCVLGLVLLVFFALDRHFCISDLKKDLEDYLSDARKVVEIADDPRVVIHYKAVVTAVSGIYTKYFPVKES